MDAITKIKAIVCKYPVDVILSIFCIKYVITDANAKTKVTATPIPTAVSTFLETPKKGHIPKNCDVITLLTSTILRNNNI